MKFLSNLSLLLIGLKLTHYIDDVSWLIVVAPAAIAAICYMIAVKIEADL